jgi:hypothetical protein
MELIMHKKKDFDDNVFVYVGWRIGYSSLDKQLNR